MNFSKTLMLFVMFGCYFNACRENPSTPEDNSQNLEITAKSLQTYSSGKIQLSALATLEDGSKEDVTDETTWNISPGNAGDIDQNGLFRSINFVTGKETVQAQYRNLTATAEIIVTTRAEVFTSYPAIMNIASGKQFQFQAFATFQDNTRDFVTGRAGWTISPGIAAEIDSNGLLKTIAGLEGTETVTAEFHGLWVKSEISVQSNFQNRFDMVTIPAGAFVMGANNGQSDERPEHSVFTDAFEIGKFEITNAQYADYLNAALARGDLFNDTGIGLISGKTGPYRNQTFIRISGGRKSTTEYIQFAEDVYAANPDYANHPVVRLTWFGAAAFCEFYGLRLPTEAEWEKACRGGQQFDYGTRDGNLTHDLANYSGTDGADTFDSIAPVGAFPANPFGLFDLSGNASEHVFDFYDETYYQNSPVENPFGPGDRPRMADLQFLTVVRGGSANSTAPSCRSAARAAFDSASRLDLEDLSNSITGFRVARFLEQ